MGKSIAPPPHQCQRNTPASSSQVTPLPAGAVPVVDWAAACRDLAASIKAKHAPVIWLPNSPLVHTAISGRDLRSISQDLRKNPCEETTFFQVYRTDSYFCSGRPTTCYETDATRGTIDSFSKRSKRRLAHLARNSSVPLISQMCLTYHHGVPASGRDVKRHLRNFLKCLRRRFPGVEYLWILEFQSRGVPHFHVFASIGKPTPEEREWFASTWNRITKESASHYLWHLSSDVWIPWDMGLGGYLTKYLEKEYQKAVPEGYDWPGRFWGNSKGIVPAPAVFTVDWIARIASQDRSVSWTPAAVATYFRKCLRRYHDHKLKPYGKKSILGRNRTGSAYVPEGTRIFVQLLNYVCSNAPDDHLVRRDLANIPSLPPRGVKT